MRHQVKPDREALPRYGVADEFGQRREDPKLNRLTKGERSTAVSRIGAGCINQSLDLSDATPINSSAWSMNWSARARSSPAAPGALVPASPRGSWPRARGW